MRIARWLGVHGATWVAVAVLGLALGVASPAGAQAGDDARAHYERGIELFDEAHFEAALAEFEAAYAITPRPVLLFNIGQIHARLGHAVEAADALERYLREAGDGITPERRALAEEELAGQTARIGHVEVVVPVADALISIDERSRGHAPLTAPVPVSVGEHRVVVTAEGYLPWSETLRIAGGERRTLAVELVRASTDPTVVQTSFPTLTVLGATVAAAGLVTFATFGTWTLVEDSNLRSSCHPICSSEQTNTIAITGAVTDVGAGVVLVGGVLLAIGLAIETGTAEPASAASVHVTAEGLEVTW